MPVRPTPHSPSVDSARLAGNFIVLAAAEALAKLATFFAFTFLGRILGPERYGSLEFVIAVMIFFALPGDFGLSLYGAREVAKDRERSFRLAGAIARLRFLMALVALAVLLLVVVWIPKPLEVKQLLACYGASLLLLPFGFQWFFQGHDRMNWVAAASIVRWGIFAVLVLVFVREGEPLFRIGLYECAGVAAMAILCLFGLLRRFRPATPLPPVPASPMRHLRQAFPIGLTETTWVVLWYLATVQLGFVVSDQSLGWFGASHRILLAIHTFVWLYFFNLLPSFSRTAEGDGTELRRLMERSLPIAVWSGIFVALVMTLLSAQFLGIAFGREFAAGWPILSVLAWIIPVAMLGGHYRYLLIAANLQKWLLYATSSAALVAAVLAFVLIRRFGALGAAIALVVAVSSEFALARWFAGRRFSGIPFLPHLRRPATALAVSLAFFFLLRGSVSWLAPPLAILVYLLFLIAWESTNLRRLCGLIVGRRSG